MKTRLILLAAMAILAVSSCNEDVNNTNTRNGKKLVAVVADGHAPETRANYSGFPSTVFETGDAIGLYAFNGSSYVISNARFVKQSDGSWLPDTEIQFDEECTYYAYFPYRSTTYTPSTAGTAEDVDTKFAAFISDASDYFWQANQSTKAGFTYSNLMIAKGAVTDTGNGTVTVKFRMRHKRGLALFTEGASDATFTGNQPYIVGTTKQFLIKPNVSTSFTDDADGTYSLKADAGEYVSHSVTAYDTFFLNVTGPEAYAYTGGTKTYSITSYKQNSEGTKTKAAAWTASYDTDNDGVFDDAKPDWLTTFTASGDGSTTASPYDATVAAQAETVSTKTASSILSSAAEVGTSTDHYDLSDPEGVGSPQYTANCYMVHARGYYKIPLVYGNAIGSPTVGPGAVNTVAFYPGTVSNGIARFINHAGTGINAPWISKSSSGSGVNKGMGINVDGAQLIWQDVNNLTTDYAIEDDYLKFRVPNASEGNAVIAVKSGSTIVWSWHIWVTPETYGNLTTVATGSHNYQVTPVNLGWESMNSITISSYKGRSCTIRISQPGGQSETFNVTQTENTKITGSKRGRCPYYQWGRKDPFVPSTGSGNSNRTVYVGDGVDSKGYSVESSYTATIDTNIQYPWKYYYNGSYSSPVTTNYYNMWDAKNSSNNGNVTTATKKTVYDPCPPGFCVPTANLLRYMGYGINGNDPVMNTWESTNYGATWTNGITGDALFFPAAGSRYDNTGGTSNVLTYGLYWSATPYKQSSGSSNYYIGRISFYYKYWEYRMTSRASALTIRPVAEE